MLACDLCIIFKENAQLKSYLWNFDGFQTNPLLKIENITKAATFKSFESYKTHNYFFLWQCFFNDLTWQTLTDDFSSYTKYELRVYFNVSLHSLL